MTETIQGNLDVQVKEALSDISNSFKMIDNLTDPELVYMYDTKSLIKFHKIRIKNCLTGILRYMEKLK